jgi:hypothetical protein
VFGERLASAANSGIFALSDEAISDIRQRTLRATFLVIVIVLLTAALLYPVKEPFSFEQAMDILEEGRGSHFDPNLIDAFAAIAQPLYDRLSRQDDAPTRAELESITQRYFFGGLDQIA